MKTVTKTYLGAAAIMAAAAGAGHAAEMGAADTPIKLAVNEWTGQHVTTRIAGKMLKSAGYQVEYVTSFYMNMSQALVDGEIDAAMEIWSSNVSDAYAKQIAAGAVTEIGDLRLQAKEGIAYPAHVAEICAGLPTWEALKDCASQFTTAETLPAGRLVDYPADWGAARRRPSHRVRSAVQGCAGRIGRGADHRIARLD